MLIKSLLITFAIIAGIVLLVCVALYLGQDRLVFFPGKYNGASAKAILNRYEKIEFTTEKNGRQIAFYIGEKDRLPDKLWIFTGGNGSLALDWDYLTTAASKKNPGYGFLLVEYPGYGYCEGKPSRVGIEENMEGAVASLARFLKTDAEKVKSRSGFLGHSLGCAVALEAAAKWESGEVIALSPFTSMRDMAARNVVGPLTNFVRNQWDNRASIRAISKLNDARVVIFHGTADRVIPVTMGEELAGLSPGLVELYKMSGLGHNDIVGSLRDELIARVTK